MVQLYKRKGSESLVTGTDTSGFGIDLLARIVTGEGAASSDPTEGPDVLDGTSGDDVIDGQGGNDIINGLGGNDILLGGSGNDELNGGEGNDTLYGEGGADLSRGGTGDDVYIIDSMADVTEEAAGAGNDTIITTLSYILSSNQEIETLTTQAHAGTDDVFLTGNQYNNILIGNAGDNIMNGVDGADMMYGLSGDDTYAIDNLGDVVVDGVDQGNDLVLTYLSHTLSNGNQIETLSTVFHQGTTAINLGGNDYDNTLIGNYGANYLNGNGGVDVMIGLNGDDTYVAENALDVVQEAAGGGSDLLYSFVSYVLAAGQSVETISTAVQGSTAAINLTGNEFAQTIVGNAGANVIDGKGGNDTLYGLGGADTFAFTSALGSGNVDFIADFTLNLDRILVGGDAGEPFAALAAGPLAAASFVIGSAAAQIDDYIIYNSTTGALLYDADGSGAGAAVQFATLAPGLALTAAHFAVGGAANAAPVVSSAASASIAENSTASTIAYQATATDTQGDRVTWSLTGADAHRLTIDAVTGAVRLKAPADYEARSTYSFNLVASDSSASTAKAVTLNVTDLGSEDSATTRWFETPSLNGDTSQAQEITVFFNDIDTNPNLYNDDLASLYILGSISNPVDDDYFSISLGAGQLLILDVDGAPTTLDTLLRIYSSGGSLLAENDDTAAYDPGSLTPPGGYNRDSMLFFRAETAGTYYFSIESFEHDTSGSYKLNVSVGPSATPAQLFSQDVDALLSGQFWDRATPTLTYAFPTAAGQYPGTAFTEVAPASKFAPFTAVQIGAVTEMLETIANVSGLSFQRDTATPGLADLRYAMTTDGDPAYAYLPTNEGPESPGGSVWFNRTNFNSPVMGNYAWMAMLHETGHALGLKHAHETPLAVSVDRDSVEYTVMAYRSYPGQDIATSGYTNETWGFAQSLMMLDIAALQRLYGANFNYNSGNTVYTWNSSTGEMSVEGAGQGAPGANRVFLTVWDGNGNDTYDMSNYSFGVRIDLQPGEWSRTSAVQLANLGEGHMARGNIANALLYYGDTRSLIENGIGGAGGDRLIANQAANKLTGNAGADVFQWKSHTDAGIGTFADRIMDFLSGTDKIDLGDVDAFPFSTSTNEAFTFIGTAAFTGSNQLRYEVIDGHAHIFADLNNNRVADFEIIVSNVTLLVATDFIL